MQEFRQTLRLRQTATYLPYHSFEFIKYSIYLEIFFFAKTVGKQNKTKKKVQNEKKQNKILQKKFNNSNALEIVWAKQTFSYNQN